MIFSKLLRRAFAKPDGGRPVANGEIGRPSSIGRLMSAPAAALFLLGACSSPPPVVSGDTYCTRTTHIDVTEFQVDAMRKDPGTFRPLAVQILDANTIRAKNCS